MASARRQAGRERARDAALGMKEGQLEAALDALPSGMAMFDAAQRFVIFNRPYTEILGYPPGFVRPGLPLAEALDYRLAQGHIAAEDGADILAHHSAGETRHIEQTFGDGRSVTLDIYPVGDGGSVTVVTDITDRKRRQAERDSQQAQFQAAIENMSYGIFMLDAEHRYVMFNRRYIDLLGMPEGYVEVGRSIRDAITFAAENGFYGPGDPVAQVEERMATYSDSRYVEVELETSLGRTVTLRRTMVDGGGSVAVLTDITDHKKADREIESAHAHTRSSIEYASRIQKSILPNEDLLHDYFKEHIIIWEPRDIVGGDLYWIRRERSGCMLAVL
ncbi:MAG: PAS-domain containing protein, partial [Alphaproteobacteria bacterium]|nr:PAS-domain containing protein [Alphaproteobacteria bacterium]